MRDQGRLFFTFTSMDSESSVAGTTDDTTNLDLLESHVGPQREPAPDKPTRFGTICLNAVGNTASNKSTQLRVALKQATRFFCILVFMRAGMAHLNHARNNNRSSRPRCQIVRAWQTQNCKAGALHVTGCFCHRPHKILFVNVSFAARKGTFANYLQKF